MLHFVRGGQKFSSETAKGIWSLLGDVWLNDLCLGFGSKFFWGIGFSRILFRVVMFKGPHLLGEANFDDVFA